MAITILAFFAVVFLAIALGEAVAIVDMAEKINSMKGQLYDMSGLEPIFTERSDWNDDA